MEGGQQQIIEDEENELELISDDEEEDEDYNCQEDYDKDLYDSKLDAMDEVIFFRDVFLGLQSTNPQMYDFYLQCLDMNE